MSFDCTRPVGRGRFVRTMCEHAFVVRWDNLTIENERGSALPGFKEPAVVRTFDAPEALGTRFYEVRARSAINEVPKRSRMPFRYTINPYRGCSHACVYCLSGDTPILMADGRTTGIIDWEDSGFYPEYHECMKLTNTLSTRVENNWYLYLPTCIAPSKFAVRWLVDRLWDIHIKYS